MEPGARRASIKTYFVGQCLIRFPNVYRSWLKSEPERRTILVDDNDLLDFLAGGHGPDPADLAVIRHEVGVRFKNITDPRLRRALVLTAGGWSQREIATQLGATEKAVERMFGYYRERNTSRGRIA
jgi:DNA-directed RNA polymerase specialized sigma24 family protein